MSNTGVSRGQNCSPVHFKSLFTLDFRRSIKRMLIKAFRNSALPLQGKHFPVQEGHCSDANGLVARTEISTILNPRRSAYSIPLFHHSHTACCGLQKSLSCMLH